MLFFLLNFKYLEVPELLIFPTDIDSSTITLFDDIATFSLISHCSGKILQSGLEGGFLKDFATGTSPEYAFETTDRMQLIALTKGITGPQAYLGGTFPTITKILSCRATVMMDVLLFRRNLQMSFVSAEDKCTGCKVHLGYDRNFAALAPYFQTSNNLVGTSDKIALIGASSGAVLAIFGAIELDGESLGIEVVHTLGMPRPGNKAFATFVEESAYPTFTLIYYRDPMPHTPPTILGYRQATTNYAWMYRPVSLQGTDKVAVTTGFFTSAQQSMDHYLANRVFFFRVSDHVMYYATRGLMSSSRGVEDALTACGQYDDNMLAETHTSDLFYF